VIDAPKPLGVAARWIVASIFTVWLGFALEKSLVNAALPLLQALFELLQNDFTILSADIAQHGPNETLQVRADLAKPFYIDGRFVYPINLRSATPIGWLQVNLTLGGLTQYALLMSIAVLAWPARSVGEYLTRLGIAVPCAAMLFLLNCLCTLFAEFQNAMYQTYAPNTFLLSMAWSKFLMGGGSAMLALLLAALCIRLAATVAATLQLRASARHCSKQQRTE
jgi:hypothetical protein